jgi:pyruvate dehydrogenase E2 component (dihydrolipoamide acetyltransferase)
MSVSVSMPQLGESVTEGTVTRWLKREGERVEADEPLLEVSTDKVDTEIPSPVSGIVRGITVAEDETVAVGAELAVIDEDGAAAGGDAAGGDAAQAQPAPAYEPPYPEPAPRQEAQPQQTQPQQTQPQQTQPQEGQPQEGQPQAESWPPPANEPPAAQAPAYEPPAPAYEQPAAAQAQPAPAQQAPPQQVPAQPAAPPAAAPPQAAAPEAQPAPEPQSAVEAQPAAEASPAPAYQPQPAAEASPSADGAQPDTESPYVTPLVRKLAAEHGIDLSTVPGTGVGGRIRKQDVLDAARALRGAAADAPQVAQPAAAVDTAEPAADTGQPSADTGQPSADTAAPPATAPPAAAPATASSGAPPQPAPKALARQPAADAGPGAPGRPVIEPSGLRGRTERLSRSRQVIAQRMMESLQTSAQLTTVVEVDVTEIARLRDRARDAFEAREGVRLSFLPFFALATVEALKVHPSVNAVMDTASGTVTYHDAEHLGIAVDTERGLMVPVIRKAGDLNIAGLARKIADLAQRTRAGQVSPDELSGGTFTLTNTGSRGALFDTPIINQPQVGILGTGAVVKRPVVVEDPQLGEVIAVRSMVYLALTYDHRLVDGADAARFLGTLKARLEEGGFEAELGL